MVEKDEFEAPLYTGFGAISNEYIVMLHDDCNFETRKCKSY